MPFDFAKCLDDGRHLQAQRASDDALLQFFRREGASMFESVRLIQQLKAITLSEAQALVHFSTTWADQREGHEQLQDTFAEALLQLGGVEVKNSTEHEGD